MSSRTGQTVCTNDNSNDLLMLIFTASIANWHSVHFTGFNSSDPFPLQWNRWQFKFANDESFSMGSFLNPAYQSLFSEYVFCGLEFFLHVRFSGFCGVVFVNQNSVWTQQLLINDPVFQVFVDEPFTYTKSDAAFHPRPAPFRSVLLYQGFKFGQIVLKTWKEFFERKWLNMFVPVLSNVVNFKKLNVLFVQVAKTVLEKMTTLDNALVILDNFVVLVYFTYFFQSC